MTRRGHFVRRTKLTRTHIHSTVPRLLLVLVLMRLRSKTRPRTERLTMTGWTSGLLMFEIEASTSQFGSRHPFHRRVPFPFFQYLVNRVLGSLCIHTSPSSGWAPISVRPLLRHLGPRTRCLCLSPSISPCPCRRALTPLDLSCLQLSLLLLLLLQKTLPLLLSMHNWTNTRRRVFNIGVVWRHALQLHFDARLVGRCCCCSRGG